MKRRLNWRRSRIHPSWNALTKRSSAPTAATVTTVRTTSEKKLRGWQSYTVVVSTG
jgi:ABC-type sulfate transport system substrate-binding protein